MITIACEKSQDSGKNILFLFTYFALIISRRYSIILRFSHARIAVSLQSVKEYQCKNNLNDNNAK